MLTMIEVWEAHEKEMEKLKEIVEQIKKAQADIQE